MLGGLPALTKLKFDFNPLHLQSKHSQAVSTFLEVSKDPQFDANSAQVLASSHQRAHSRSRAGWRCSHKFEQTRTIAKILCLLIKGKKLRSSVTPRNRPLTRSIGGNTTGPTHRPATIAMLRGVAKKLEITGGQATTPGTQAVKRLASSSDPTSRFTY